jgi:hypothetical protein
MRTKIVAMMLACLCISHARSEENAKRYYRAHVIAGESPTIDGLLDDPAWGLGEWSGGFVQYDPYNGGAPSQDTEFKILYDDHSLYVAIRARDTAPDSIVSRLTRRDQEDGDLVSVCFDSYHDLRTAFVFGVNAAGVKFDHVISNDGRNEDASWDPNWWVKTSLDEQGWVAEMRIPFSQLRFESQGGGFWGLQVIRRIHRKGEMDFWSHIPRDSPGVVHRFGTLSGLEEIKPRGILDLTPYAVTATSRYPAVDGHPFLTGRDRHYKLGLDAKAGLSNNMILDLTLNPDFGQVEADPSVVNLTAFETFFSERRPFFIEGNSISRFNLGMGSGGHGSDDLFYSRRIGRRPSGQLGLESGAYASIPSSTAILGAAKLTGKNSEGLSLVLIDAVTAEEHAEIDLEGNRTEMVAEPLTNYFLGRIQKDNADGTRIMGLMLTGVHRRLDGGLSDQLHAAAYTGGVDLMQYFKNKTWSVDVSAAFSQVRGSERALLRTQLSSARYFQRPGTPHLMVDSTRTSLTGSGGKVLLSKSGGGHWSFKMGGTWKTPGFEINDLGYMREADRVVQIAGFGYREWRPKAFYRTYNIYYNQSTSWDFSGKNLLVSHNINGFIRYKNYWYTSASMDYLHNHWSVSQLRGGPVLRMNNQLNTSISAGSDMRRQFSAYANASLQKGTEQSMSRYGLGGGLTYKPTNTLNLSFNPSYTRRMEAMQFILLADHGGNPRYIFGTIDQEMLSVSLRLNYTLMPDLSIQLWGQPFVAAGQYRSFKYVTNAAAPVFADRYALLDGDQLVLNQGIYQVDEDLDGIVDYSFRKPDFRIMEFLSNAVLRWEYSPGSSLYLVWSQKRAGTEQAGVLDYFDGLHGLLGEKAHHTFLIKFSYRIGLS